MAETKQTTTPNTTGTNRNTAGVNFQPSVIDRVSGAIKYLLTGQNPDGWFNAGVPLAPVAPPDEAGRQFDYQTSQNMNTTPRTGEAISFAQMRALADNCDVLRLVIETRKDELSALDWTIKLKGKDGQQDQRCLDLMKFFQNPDGEHTWQDWIRMLLEDLFVLDAPTLYPRMNKGGGIYGFEPLDGATIKRVIDLGGRTPLNGVAYQQVLKGVAAFDYTKDELIYKPRNPRTHKLYGYSPVEQIIMTVNIAIRRQLSQLSYYTDGSVPDSIFSVPAEWNPDQVKKFQAWWDERLSGNLQGKRRAQFIPAGVAPVNTKEALLKDTFDEWLARIVCYAFSVPPTPFVKETNRATATTAKEAATEQGLLPLMKWVVDLINLIIVKYFKYDDICFAWEMQADLDALAKAQVSQIYLQNGVLTADEVRDKDLSMPPLTQDQKDEIAPPAPPATLLPVLPDGSPAPSGAPPDGKPPTGKPPTGKPAGDPEPKKAQAATLKKAVAIKPINRNRKLMKDNQAELSKAIKAAFAKAKKNVLAQVAEKSASGLLTKIRDKQAVDLDLDELDNLQKNFADTFENITLDAVNLGFIQIHYDNDSANAPALDQANEKAIQWAQDRAAEMVGKKVLDDGSLIDNPNEAWQITDSTRQKINALVTQATEEGWTNDELADAINDDDAFSDDRADLIAVTETRLADCAGNMIAYRESGVVEKKAWLVGEDSCDECQANADQGDIDLDDAFSDGSDSAPAHPRCTCDTIPRVADLTDTDE